MINLCETPEYEAWIAELEATDRRATERRSTPPPMLWGTELGNDRYFCVPCWRGGVADGSHPYDVPPCDAAPRGPYDPR